MPLSKQWMWPLKAPHNSSKILVFFLALPLRKSYNEDRSDWLAFDYHTRDKPLGNIQIWLLFPLTQGACHAPATS